MRVGRVVISRTLIVVSSCVAALKHGLLSGRSGRAMREKKEKKKGKNQQRAREDGRDIRARGHDDLILVGNYLVLRET